MVHVRSSARVRPLLWLGGLVVALLVVALWIVAAGPGAPKGQVVVTSKRPKANATVQGAPLPATTAPGPASTSTATTSTVPVPLPAAVSPGVATAGAPRSVTTKAPVRAADPVASTTTAPVSTVAAPTSTTVTPVTTASVTLISFYSEAVKISVGGHSYTLAPGAHFGPVLVTPAASGNDIISVTSVADPTCGVGDAMKYFYAGLSYQLSVMAGLGKCGAAGTLGPNFQVVGALTTTG